MTLLCFCSVSKSLPKMFFILATCYSKGAPDFPAFSNAFSHSIGSMSLCHWLSNEPFFVFWQFMLHLLLLYDFLIVSFLVIRIRSHVLVSKTVINTKNSISIWSPLNWRLKGMMVHIHREKGDHCGINKLRRPLGERELVLDPEARAELQKIGGE